MWTKQGIVVNGGSGGPNLGKSYYSPHVIAIKSTLLMWFGAWHPGPTIGYATH